MQQLTDEMLGVVMWPPAPVRRNVHGEGWRRSSPPGADRGLAGNDVPVVKTAGLVGREGVVAANLPRNASWPTSSARGVVGVSLKHRSISCPSRRRDESVCRGWIDHTRNCLDGPDQTVCIRSGTGNVRTARDWVQVTPQSPRTIR